MGVKKTAPKKKAVTAKRKPTTKKRGTRSTKKETTASKLKKINRKYRQTGATYVELDETKQAKKPGKRISASGKTYYERRANRSDKGKLLGTVERGFCYRKNSDGSTTIYGESMTSAVPCPRGGTVKKTSVVTSNVSALNGARKKKATPAQLAARAKFAANVRAGKYRK